MEIIENLCSKFFKGTVKYSVLSKSPSGVILKDSYEWQPSYNLKHTPRALPYVYIQRNYERDRYILVCNSQDLLDRKTTQLYSNEFFGENGARMSQKIFVEKILDWIEANIKDVSVKLYDHVKQVHDSVSDSDSVKKKK